MTDERDFEWPESAVENAEQMVRRYATVQEVMQFLLPYVKDALAAEYDRGYETALKMETDLQKDAWDEGFEDGTLYGKDLETMSGEAPYEIYEPRNPYA